MGEAHPKDSQTNVKRCADVSPKPHSNATFRPRSDRSGDQMGDRSSVFPGRQPRDRSPEWGQLDWRGARAIRHRGSLRDMQKAPNWRKACFERPCPACLRIRAIGVVPTARTWPPPPRPFPPLSRQPCPCAARRLPPVPPRRRCPAVFDIFAQVRRERSARRASVGPASGR